MHSAGNGLSSASSSSFSAGSWSLLKQELSRELLLLREGDRFRRQALISDHPNSMTA
jgi:hypothetical protein